MIGRNASAPSCLDIPRVVSMTNLWRPAIGTSSGIVAQIGSRRSHLFGRLSRTYVDSGPTRNEERRSTAAGIAGVSAHNGAAGQPPSGHLFNIRLTVGRPSMDVRGSTKFVLGRRSSNPIRQALGGKLHRTSPVWYAAGCRPGMKRSIRRGKKGRSLTRKSHAISKAPKANTISPGIRIHCQKRVVS